MCASIQSAAIWTCAASTPNGHGLSLLIFRYQLLTPVIPFRKSEWIGKMTMLTVASNSRPHTHSHRKENAYQYITRFGCKKSPRVIPVSEINLVTSHAFSIPVLAMPPLNLDRGCSITARIGWLHRPYGDVVFVLLSRKTRIHQKMKARTYRKSTHVWITSLQEKRDEKLGSILNTSLYGQKQWRTWWLVRESERMRCQNQITLGRV